MTAGGLEIERKFLVELRADPATTPGARTLELEQVYLVDDGSGSRRIRRTVEAGETTLHLTTKVPIAPGVREEREGEIDETTYAALAADADPDRVPIRKTRHAVPHGRHVWEIDVYHGLLSGLLTAEVELADVAALEDELEPPPCIAIVRDLTGDPRYTNAALARTGTSPG